MSKKQWMLIAAVVAALVTALCIFYFPRKAMQTLELSDKKVASIFVTTTKGLDDPQRYTTTDAGEIAAAMECLQALRLRYYNTSSIYSYRSGEDARMVVRYFDGEERIFTFAVSGEVRRERKNYQAIDNAPLEELMAQIKGWKDSEAMPVSIWGTVSLGPLDQQRFRTRDAEEIAGAMALLRGLQARRTYDDNTVSVRNDAYNAQVTLSYADGGTELLAVGEWGWVRYQEQNYTAEDAAVTKELMELVKGWIITG